MSPVFLWSWPVRVIHWGLALSIFIDHFVIAGGDEPHQWIGYLALVFLLLRIVYFFLRPDFVKNFPVSWIQLKGFLNSLRTRRMIDYAGHNPLAALVYLLMWFLVLVLATTGWMMSWERYWGEEWLENLHHQTSNALILLVVIHLLGILHDAVHFRRPTWMGMIHGKR